MPFVHYLQQQRINLKHELQLAKLPALAMYDPDSFVPSRNYWSLIANITALAGLKDLGFIVGLQSGADAAGPGLAKRLLALPTLHKALVQFCEIGSEQSSRAGLWLEPADKHTHRLYYQTSFGPEHMAYKHFQWYGLMAAISTIRLFVGQHWYPRRVGLASEKEPGQHIRKFFSDTHFQTNLEHSFISISNRLLGIQPQFDENLPLSQNYGARVNLPSDFIDCLKLVLRSYLPDGAPSIELAADITCLSKRTLQRRLDDEGLNYRGLIVRLRYEVAIELMQKRVYTMTDIAYQLGYSDPTHFSRAFRSIAGVSPHEYSRQLSS